MSGVMLGTSVLLGGAGALGASMRDKGTPQTTTFVPQPTIDGRIEGVQAANNYGMSELNRIQSGQMPSWYQGIAPILQQQGQEQLSRNFFGGPGSFDPGILASQQSFDVGRGLGRGASAGKNYGSQLQKYGDLATQIQQEISKIGFQGQQRASEFFPQLLGQLPINQPGQFVTSPGQAAQPHWLETLAGGAGSMLGQSGGGANLGNMFGDIMNQFGGAPQRTSNPPQGLSQMQQWQMLQDRGIQVPGQGVTQMQPASQGATAGWQNPLAALGSNSAWNRGLEAGRNVGNMVPWGDIATSVQGVWNTNSDIWNNRGGM